MTRALVWILLACTAVSQAAAQEAVLTDATSTTQAAATPSPAAARTSMSSARASEPRDIGFDFLGPAREISHSSSASRDTALIAAVFTPRLVRAAGADFSIVSYATEQHTWRLGVFGMLELFGEGHSDRGLPFPTGDIGLWRGLFGYSIAWSFDRMARDMCGERCAMEATVSFRHESEHYTASNDGDTERRYVGYPHIGDFVMPDVAMRLPLGDFDLTLRLQTKLWTSRHAQTPYRFGPGGDVVLRWRLLERLHPFTSTFVEYAFADNAPNAYFIRNLTGVVIPSRYGDISLHLVGEIGHGKGFMVLQEEASLGVGMRFSFF